MMVKELIKNLQNIKQSLQEKEIVTMGENGIYHQPEIAFVMKDYSKLDKSKKNIDYIVLR